MRKLIALFISIMLSYSLYYSQIKFIFYNYNLVLLAILGINLLLLNYLGKEYWGLIYSFFFSVLYNKIDFTEICCFSCSNIPIFISTVIISFLIEILSLSKKKEEDTVFKNIFPLLIFSFPFLIINELLFDSMTILHIYTIFITIFFLVTLFLENSITKLKLVMFFGLIVLEILFLKFFWTTFYNIPVFLALTKFLPEINKKGSLSVIGRIVSSRKKEYVIYIVKNE